MYAWGLGNATDRGSACCFVGLHGRQAMEKITHIELKQYAVSGVSFVNVPWLRGLGVPTWLCPCEQYIVTLRTWLNSGFPALRHGSGVHGATEGVGVIGANFGELNLGCQACLLPWILEKLLILTCPVFSVALGALCVPFETHLLTSGFLFSFQSLLFYISKTFKYCSNPQDQEMNVVPQQLKHSSSFTATETSCIILNDDAQGLLWRT